MPFQFSARFVLLAAVLAGAPTLWAQEADSLRAGIRDTLGSSVAIVSRPSSVRLALKTGGAAFGYAVSGVMLGNAVDAAYCKIHHGNERSVFLGPCFFYAAAGTAIGWFGGGMLGAVSAASSIARKRGCSQSNAIVRAVAGAAVGTLPGVLIVSARPEKYPAPRGAIMFGSPLLAAAGAATAVAGCHR
jgi:hypothetical protein